MNEYTQLRVRSFLLHIGTFLLIFGAAKFGQYVFWGWHTSPAVLWPPTGIVIAILLLGGYSYAIPIFFGLILASFTAPVGLIFPNVITTPFAQILGSVCTVWLLQQFKFENHFFTVKNVLKFIVVIIIACTVAPTLVTLVSVVSGHLATTMFISWSRAWAGYVFSCLILTPLILAWAKPERLEMNISPYESVIVGTFVIVASYLLYWTHNLASFTFLFFALFFFAHLWVSLRFSTRLVTLAVFMTTFVGTLGLFLSPNPDHPLNTQLLSSELFLFLAVPIFYLFSALVKERSITIADLKIALTKIEAESAAQVNFISVLAHESRNPLAPVKTTLEILSTMKLDLETHELVESANHQVHVMRRLLDDLLDITRITQGKLQLQIEHTHLCTMLDHSIELTKSLFNEDHILVQSPVCDDSIWLEVDPVRFEQALINILNNAAKYSNPGSSIEITSALTDTNLVIKIKDSGVGIDPIHLEDVFEPFWQAKRSTASPSGGVGIGLSLTKHIIDLHGGTIRAESEGAGKGSTFIITMPYIMNETPHKEGSEPRADSNKVYRVLVVDDNKAAADSLARLLSLKGHTMNTAYSGIEAVEAAKTFKPDIILLDIGLPDINGYEVAKTLRAKGFKNQIVALSGYGQKEDKEKAIKSGCNEHITKPMGIVRFEAYLQTLL